MDFSANLPGLRILAWFKKPGKDLQQWFLHLIATLVLRGFPSEPELQFIM